MSGDFDGVMHVRLAVTGNNLVQVAQGNLVGKFKAPLGDDSFMREGSIKVEGLFNVFSSGENLLQVDVVGGGNGFSDVTGNMDFSWLRTDSEIWYVGTFYF